MFEFNEHQRNLVEDYLVAAIEDSNKEFEVRFSSGGADALFREGVPVDGEIRPDNFVFKPMLSDATFERVKRYFWQQNYLTDAYHIKDTFYDGHIRKSVEQALSIDDLQPLQDIQPREIWIVKSRDTWLDIWEIPIRLSLATETPIITAPVLSASECKLFRNKQRFSFDTGLLRVDFTKVTETDCVTQKTRFSNELELEFLSSRLAHKRVVTEVELKGYLQEVLDTITLVICSIHDNDVVTSVAEAHNVSIEYQMLTGQSQSSLPKSKVYFIGAQPETLHHRTLNRLGNGQFAVSPKYDGERALLLISDNKEVYFVNRKLAMKATGIFTTGKDSGTLLDVEKVHNVFYVFDIIYYRGQNLREETINYLLRSQLAAKVTKRINSARIVMKPVYSNSTTGNNLRQAIVQQEKAQQEANAVAVAVAIATDGFIFTPIDDNYPLKARAPRILKWKPADMNSIDFLVQVIDGSTWKLLVANSNADIAKSLTVFAPAPSTTSLSCLPTFAVDNQIVECTWDYDRNEFILWRPRGDKTRPNHESVALDVWESIKKVLTIDDVLSYFEGGNVL